MSKADWGIKYQYAMGLLIVWVFIFSFLWMPVFWVISYFGIEIGLAARQVLMIIFAVVSLAIAVWMRFYVSYELSFQARRLGPVLFATLVFLITLGTMFLWTQAIIAIVAPIQLDFLSALVVTLAFGLVASLAILVKGTYSWTHTSVGISSYYPDLHTKVCKMVGSTPEIILPGYHNPKVVVSELEDFKLTDSIHTIVTIELGLSMFIVSTILLIFIWLVEVISPAYHDVLSPWTIYPIIGVVMIPFWLVSAVIRYRRWKEFWMTYWKHIRNMTLPEERILDLVPNPPTPFPFWYTHDEGDPYVHHAMELAKNENLDIGASPSHLSVLWVHWFLQTERRIKRISNEKLQGMKDFEEACNELENMPRKFDERIFLDLVRESLILESAWIAESWPEVVRGISELNGWASTNDTERMSLFEMATKEMEKLRTKPSVPIPHSIGWLVGFLGLLIAVVPYTISLISAMISQGG